VAHKTFTKVLSSFQTTEEMASVTQPPRQFKQPSRKGKKAWRKHVDITEVQEGLEAVRGEIITG
jgi:nucleolar protein 53